MEVSLSGATENLKKKLTAKETKQRYNREYNDKVAFKKKKSKEKIPKLKKGWRIDSIWELYENEIFSKYIPNTNSRVFYETDK